MPRAVNVAAEADLLCENCGYVLNGLPADGNCPECGAPIAVSAASVRLPSQWEQLRSASAFLSTTISTIFHPARFFRTFATRGPLGPSAAFEGIHLFAAGVLLTPPVLAQLHPFFFSGNQWRPNTTVLLVAWIIAGMVIGGVLRLLSRLAARLTTWEARHRGLRMPRHVVVKAMHYHSPHFVVVAAIVAGTLVCFVTVDGSYLLYLYVLSGEVVVGSIYLFWTYWIAMRNVMYANK